MRKLRLKRGQERRILEGSLWVFSNQVEGFLRDYQPGEIVQVTTRSGRFLGVGYVNPHSLIAGRLLSRDEVEINVEFFCQRFRKAQKLRRKILPDEYAVREVFSEADDLPGLIVDRYGEVLVIQIATVGIERARDLLIPALQDVYHPQGIYERSDLAVRKLEGLEERAELVAGLVPDKPIWVKYAGSAVPVDVKNGQKTGLYLDQRANIQYTAHFADGVRVLDAFSYVGPWGLAAARCGAREVTFLDSSPWALAHVEKAARRNRVADRCRTVVADAFDALKKMTRKKTRFDLVILDPPSFIKARSRFKEGYKGYFDINQRALALVQPGGLLVTCSCSHHMEEAAFLDLLRSVLQRTGREGRILFKGRQGPDHPVRPSMPETEYLHCVALQVD